MAVMGLSSNYTPYRGLDSNDRDSFGGPIGPSRRVIGMLNGREALNTHFQGSPAYWRDIYDRTDLYAILYQKRRDIVLSLVDELRPVSGAQVLDAGCGPGLT